MCARRHHLHGSSTHDFHGGAFRWTGSGVLAGEDGVTGEGETGATAAAGWLRFSDFGPSVEVAFGVPLADAEDAGAGDGPAGPDGAVGAAGVAIGYAGAGCFLANSVTVNSIARSMGKRTTCLFLSIQP